MASSSPLARCLWMNCSSLESFETADDILHHLFVEHALDARARRQRIFGCAWDSCRETFSQNHLLLQHLRSDHDIEATLPFVCQVCFRHFGTDVRLRVHYQSDHARGSKGSKRARKDTSDALQTAAVDVGRSPKRLRPLPARSSSMRMHTSVQGDIARARYNVDLVIKIADAALTDFGLSTLMRDMDVYESFLLGDEHFLPDKQVKALGTDDEDDSSESELAVGSSRHSSPSPDGRQSDSEAISVEHLPISMRKPQASGFGRVGKADGSAAVAGDAQCDDDDWVLS